ncbi:MAG: sulfotransferase [Acidocella sp.]|nr:sulfotransferase [Acidocella sp.]
MLNTELCACGSGLRGIRCCGADFTAVPDATSLEILNPKAVEATNLFNEKNFRDAEALALKILDIAPNQRAALRVLFEIRRAENKPGVAEVLARRLASIPAESNAVAAAAQLHLAQMLVAQSRHADAEPAAQAAVKLSPRDANTHHVMGVVLTETGQVHAGERHYRTAMRLLGRDDGTVLANLAWNLKLQGRLDEAAGIYEQALANRPDNPRGIGGFAQVEAGRGRLPQAMVLLDQALATWPNDRTLRLLRALADLQDEQFDAVIARLNGPLEGLMPPELAARGQAAQRLGHITDAVAAFATAKQMQRERYGQRYEPAAFLQKAEACKAFFTADQMLNLPRAASGDGPQPVFLLGFARSGTSLLEQMLAKLPGFAAADGLAPVSALVSMATKLAANGAGADYPQVLANIAVGDGQMIPSQLREQYMANLSIAGVIQPDTKFIIDRAPDNHWHLGLIKLLFPDAPVIHLLRHPLDIMLSNFGQDRRLEANCGVSMVATARHYDVSMSMIKHYRGQLALRYLPVRYEPLVSDPLAVLQNIVKFIGAAPVKLPSKAALRINAFQPSPRIPAHVAVQQPLHERGAYRYRAYEAALPQLFNEVRPILEGWIEALGYGASV